MPPAKKMSTQSQYGEKMEANIRFFNKSAIMQTPSISFQSVVMQISTISSQWRPGWVARGWDLSPTVRVVGAQQVARGAKQVDPDFMTRPFVVKNPFKLLNQLLAIFFHLVRGQ
jgi:hypothetical protein